MSCCWLTSEHKLKFRNATGVSFQMLDIAGRTDPLVDTLNLDTASRINIETVNAIFDVGMLDDARVTIGGTYNQNAARFTDTKTATAGRKPVGGSAVLGCE